jgi:transcriptional regulator NrdR family protein
MAPAADKNPLGPKIRCPECGQSTSRVLPRSDIQRDYERYRRLRECQACHTRFITAETVERVLTKRVA